MQYILLLIVWGMQRWADRHTERENAMQISTGQHTALNTVQYSTESITQYAGLVA